jgi:hypothetical protein
MRLRTDEVLFDALTAPYNGQLDDLKAKTDFLRSRFRLLVAHEVGHAFGVRHQYIGSAQGMSSVMDYPFPHIDIRNGVPILTDAFPVGIGAWDRQAIVYGYRNFTPDEEPEALRSIIEQGEREGIWRMTDEDSDEADPQVQKWDFGTDPIESLSRVLEIRRAALGRFSRGVIPSRQPLGILQDSLSPVYLLHQFEVKAVASMLGGYIYRHAMRDDQGPTAVPPRLQRSALSALLLTLDADTCPITRCSCTHVAATHEFLCNRSIFLRQFRNYL